ncbi:MAG: DUF6174 domain-containing protein [Mycobacteriales bacterium]
MRRPNVLNVVLVGVAMAAVACGPQEAVRTGSGASSPPPAATPTSAGPTADPSTSSASPTASPSPTDLPSPEPTETPSPSPTRTPPPGAEALAAAEKLWTSKSVSSYSFTYEPRCFCPRTKLLVTVVDGSVKSVEKTPEQDDSFAPGLEFVPEVADAPTIEKLFAELRKAYGDAEPAAAVQVTYDSEYGYPTTAYIDWSTMMADEESGYTVSTFDAAAALDVAGTWRPKKDNGAFITFAGDGRYKGSDGCNGSSGTWTTASGTLKVTTGIHTEIGCDNQPIDEWIAKADVVTVAGNSMTIATGTTKQVLTRAP